MLRYITTLVWRAVQFLSGSTTKRIPYEVAFALQSALSNWSKQPVVLTTALLDEPNYYFLGTGEQLIAVAEAALGIKLSCELVQIAFPAMYRRSPLFCIPLYHELGHFVDRHLGIVDASLLLRPVATDPEVAKVSSAFGLDAARDVAIIEQIVTSHRREYFADAFCACYTGSAGGDFLKSFAGDQGISASHPSVADRLDAIDARANGSLHPKVSMFDEVVTKLIGENLLIRRFNTVDLAKSFGMVRPVDLTDEEDVHGVFLAGWKYLQETLVSSPQPWDALSTGEVESTINGLIEKSIRNYMITLGWNHAAAQP